MNPRSIVIAQSRASRNATLVTALNTTFKNVGLASTYEELRQQLAKHKPSVAVVELGLIKTTELEALKATYPDTQFICMHPIDAKVDPQIKKQSAGVCAQNDVSAISEMCKKQRARATAA